MNTLLNTFPVAGFFFYTKEKGDKESLADPPEKQNSKNVTLPLTLAQMKRLQITCKMRCESRVDMLPPPPPTPEKTPRTPILCLCKHTLKIMYIMWVFVLPLNGGPRSDPHSCPSHLCSSGPVALLRMCQRCVIEREREKER